MNKFISSTIDFFFFLIPQALAKFQTNHRVTTISGIEQEESLLSESAARETSLNSTIIDLENEQRQVNFNSDLQKNACLVRG